MSFTRYSRSRPDTRDVVAAGAATRERCQLTGAGLVGPFAACPWAVEREKARKTHYPSRLVHRQQDLLTAAARWAWLA